MSKHWCPTYRTPGIRGINFHITLTWYFGDYNYYCFIFFRSLDTGTFYGKSNKPSRIADFLEKLENNEPDLPDELYIEPPENATGAVSDEDSGDEEGGTINNLPGSLLRSEYSPGDDSAEAAIPIGPKAKKSKS